MSSSVKSTLQIILFLGLGVFLAWLSLRNVSADEIFHAFSSANYLFLFLSILAGLISHISRAMRWKLLLQPLGHQPKTTTTFYAVMIGYLANYGVPRMGEITRCTLLTRYEKIPFQESLGTVITERIIDTLSLLAILLGSLLIAPDSFMGIFNTFIFGPADTIIQQKIGYERFFWIAGLSFLGIALPLWMLRKKIIAKLSGKFGNIIKGFLQGLKSIRYLKNKGTFLMHTFIIWLMYFFTIYTCIYCFPETAGLGIANTIALLICGTLGVMVTTGGLGAYHIIIQNLLLHFAIIPSIAASFPWLVWGCGFLLIVFLGVISLILLPLTNKKAAYGKTISGNKDSE